MSNYTQQIIDRNTLAWNETLFYDEVLNVACIVKFKDTGDKLELEFKIDKTKNLSNKEMQDLVERISKIIENDFREYQNESLKG